MVKNGYVRASLCEERSGNILKEVQETNIKIDKILDNHLPHINAEITTMKLTLAKYLGIAMGAFAVVEIIIKVIL